MLSRASAGVRLVLVWEWVVRSLSHCGYYIDHFTQPANCKSSMRASILYISYDGMLEPLGQSQVLAYLKRLAQKHRVYLISFEKAGDWRDEVVRAQLQKSVKKAGIDWYPLRYHKYPSALATAYDVFQGILFAAWIVWRYKVGVVHARSYVASVVALFLKNVFGVKFIFDMRSFWADERVDAGLWGRSGRLYRTAKWFERKFLLVADRVVSLTHAGVSEMQKFPYLQVSMPRFEVIPTCTDLGLFCLSDEKQTEPDAAVFTLGWVGAVKGWYLFDEALLFFKVLKEKLPKARFCILNRENHPYILERLTAYNISSELVEIKSVEHDAVPGEMGRMDAGIFFIMPVFSKRASAPTKLGEFLGCGVPCLANDGIGDMTQILESENVGVVIRDFDDESREEALKALLLLGSDPSVRQRCVGAAGKHFSLDEGVAAYDRIYKELTSLK